MPPVQPQPQPQGGFYPQPYPVPAPQPAVDLDKLKQDVVSELAETVRGMVPQAPAPEPTQEAKRYDDWGTVFEDVSQLVDKKLQEREQQSQQVDETVKQKSEENQKWIDDTLGQLRTSGYLPPVTNQFDNNDPGKAAENELLGYAIAMGTSNLGQAAQELKFRHDNGYRYDYNTRQFVSAKETEAPTGQPDMFGSMGEQPQPAQPPAPVAQPYPQMPVAYPAAPGAAPVMPATGYPYPVGPSNPYMPAPQIYPPGFNAPVSNGASYTGVQGQAPSLGLLRKASYDQIVDTFNRTQAG